MSNSFQNLLWKTSMIAAPMFISIAQFFWSNGLVTPIAGVLQVFAFLCWIFAFQGMFHQLKQEMPNYAVAGFFLAVYACLGGNNFGVDGIYTHYMGISDLAASSEVHQNIGTATIFYLFLPGTLFPLSLLLLAINLLRKNKINKIAGILLSIGAIGFPLSRIPRIDLLAHADNLVLLVAHVWIAFELFHQTKSNPKIQIANS